MTHTLFHALTTKQPVGGVNHDLINGLILRLFTKDKASVNDLRQRLQLEKSANARHI